MDVKVQERRQFTLDSLPIEIIEKVLSYLSYDEISNKRMVCRRFNTCCKRLLNQGFLKVERFHAKCLKEVKKQLPRRESERRSHPMSRHCEVLTSIETRLSLLGMTFTKYMDMSLCCFIPGKVIDEIYRVLWLLQKEETPPRTHEILQELRDISSMAMEHFDERIAPSLKLHMLPPRSLLGTGLVCNVTSGGMLPSTLAPHRSHQNRCPSVGCGHTSLVEETAQLKATCAALRRCMADLKIKMATQGRKVREQEKGLREQERSLREQARAVSEQTTRVAELEGKLGETNRKLLEHHKQFAEVVTELAEMRGRLALTTDGRAGRKRTASAALIAEDESRSRPKMRSTRRKKGDTASSSPAAKAPRCRGNGVKSAARKAAATRKGCV